MDKLLFASLEAEVIGRLRRDLSPVYIYHNAEHTIDVMEAADRLARMEGFDEAGRLLIRTAALFHDTGYLEGRTEHEIISKRIARDYLTRLNIDEAQIVAVERMIDATRVPQQPQDHASMILCDADLDYLGREDYLPLAARMYSEFLSDGTVRNEKEWLELQVKFLGAHRYFTGSAKRTREPGLHRRLEQLRAESGVPRTTSRA